MNKENYGFIFYCNIKELFGNISDEKIAERLGTSWNTVQRWKRGAIPQVPQLLKASKLLNASVNNLLSEGYAIARYGFQQK